MRWRAWWTGGWPRLLAAIAVIQVLFWGTLILIGETPREHAYMASNEVHDIRVRQLPGLTPDFGPLEGTTRQDFPFLPGPCYHGYDSPAYQFSFEVKGASDVTQALYVPWISDNFVAYANGRLIATPRGQFSLKPSREERRPFLIGIPRDLMQPGVNRIDMVVTRNGCTPYVETVYFGPLEPFKAYESHMAVLGHYVPIVTAVAGGLVALVALCLLPISGYSPLFTSLAAFMAALSLRAYAFVWAGNGIDYPTFFALVYGIHYLSLATGAVFVQAWTGQPGWHRPWSAAIFGGFCIVLVVTVATRGELYDVVMGVLNPISVIGLTAYTVWSLWRLSRTRPGEAGRAVLLASLFLASEIYDAFVVIFHARRFIDAAYYLPIVLIAAVAGNLVVRGYRLYREADAARTNLALQVAQKEVEIRDSYALLREQEQVNAIHTERQRLIRDMHDGIGGQLVSLMLQLKGPPVAQERIRQQVQAAIDDLRLIIDSMDSVGDSLDVALAIFRERMQPRLKAAGITLDWQNRLNGGVQGFRPQEILHIYRILQEGMTNILKYADATRVSLILMPQGEDIAIELRDNGHGFDVTAAPNGGRGLNHMQKRARLLGSDLTVSSTPEGTVIAFSVARPQPGA